MSGSPYVTNVAGYPCACGGWVSAGLPHRCWPSYPHTSNTTPVPEGWRLALSAEDVDRIARRVVELWEARAGADAPLPRAGGSVK